MATTIWPVRVSGSHALTVDFDALLDRLQSSLLDPDARARIFDRSKTQLDAIAKKLRGE